MVHSKLEGKVQVALYHMCPRIHSLLHTNIPCPCGIFVTVDEHTWTFHNHPKSIVYFRAHSWNRTFYGFEQRYSDMYQSWFQAEYFNCSPNPCLLIYPPCPAHCYFSHLKLSLDLLFKISLRTSKFSSL